MANATEERRLRDAAIQRGADFIFLTSKKQKCFASYGSFLICCFALLAATSRNSKLRAQSRDRAKQLLRRWSQKYRSVPSAISSELLLEFVLVHYAKCRLGLHDSADATAIRLAARNFSASDLLGFDPREEPPPEDLSYRCHCAFQNARGRKTCKQCKRRLRMRSRYRVWMDALANTYVAERSGVLFGASYADVLKWMPVMRPYPNAEVDEETLRDALYAVTHVVYTLNDYGTYRLSRRWLPREFAFLQANVASSCTRKDPELLGELLDSLKAFGLSNTHSLIRRGTKYLLAEQNKDGSWGDPREDNIRTRCHTTWTAIDGLRTYAWRRERLCTKVERQRRLPISAQGFQPWNNESTPR